MSEEKNIKLSMDDFKTFSYLIFFYDDLLNKKEYLKCTHVTTPLLALLQNKLFECDKVLYQDLYKSYKEVDDERR